MNDNTRSFFTTLAEILLRCWMLSLVLLLPLCAMIFFMHDSVVLFAFSLNVLQANEFFLIVYCGIGLFSLLAVVLFLIPCVAIRFVLTK